MSDDKIIHAGAFNDLKQCRYGMMLYNRYDQYVGRSFAEYGEFSESEITIFRQAIHPGNVVLDIGANIGAHTLFFSQAVKPNGIVFAFEPQPIVFQTLCANMALNSISNVRCLNAATGEKAGSIIVPLIDYTQVANYGGVSLGEYTKGEHIQQITVDSLNLSACNFIKIDVEGMELQTLQGAQQTIDKYRPLLFVENDRPDNSAKLISYIDEIGYTMYWHIGSLYNPNNFDKKTEDIFHIVSINMLCVPKETGPKVQGLPLVEGPSDTWRDCIERQKLKKKSI